MKIRMLRAAVLALLPLVSAAVESQIKTVQDPKEPGALTIKKMPMASAALAGSVTGGIRETPTTSHPIGPATMLTLDDYQFIPPEGWQLQKKPDQILLSQVPDQTGCIIHILPPQASSGDLGRDVKAVFDVMYQGWNYQQSGERQFVQSGGILPKGLEYCMYEAAMSTTSADGLYHLEDGVALVVKIGQQVAIVAARHRGLMAHTDCLRKYQTWRRFFNSFAVKNIPTQKSQEADAAQRIIGAWSQTESGASSEYVFAANGQYARVGALGTVSSTRDLNFEYLHIKTYAFQGDGSYSIAGNVLTLQGRGGNNSEQVRFRFEQANHGGAGWRDRLWLLTKDRFGENEVCYDRMAKR